jgi:hypothetical protein
LRNVDHDQASACGALRGLFQDNVRSLKRGEALPARFGHREPFCATQEPLRERLMSVEVLHLINQIGALEAELEAEFTKNGCDFR